MSLLRLVPILSLLAIAGLLSSCDREPPAPPPAAMPLAAGDGSLGWRGVLGCADCDGIDTSLALSRAGPQRDYLLVEVYLTESGGERFIDQGSWQPQDGGLIRLQSADGSQRIYAVQSDGRLQPRDGRGRRFAQREGDFLSPIAETNDL